jgi:hypothetical protein
MYAYMHCLDPGNSSPGTNFSAQILFPCALLEMLKTGGSKVRNTLKYYASPKIGYHAAY